MQLLRHAVSGIRWLIGDDRQNRNWLRFRRYLSRDTVTITRSGKVVVVRSVSADVITQVITFENYVVNGAHIAGVKTRSTTSDELTGSGSSVTSVDDGIIIFADGTQATWMNDRIRTTTFMLIAETGKPTGGTLVTEVDPKVIAEDGHVVYSHEATTPLVENIACGKRKHGPVSGVLETIYHDDILLVNYGDDPAKTGP